MKFLRDFFLEEIYLRMKLDKNIFFITADFGSPVVDKIKEEFNDRFLNVGIAEQNLINISTGLALEGFKVFAYGISSFISMRCLEQIRINLGLLNQIKKLNINIISVGAGTSYEVSGPTHHCLEDISIINSIPGIEIFCPSDIKLTKLYIDRALNKIGTKYIRLDARINYSLESEFFLLEDGFRIIKRAKNKKFIISCGYFVNFSKQFNANIIDLFLLNSFNFEKLFKEVENYSKLITIEDSFLPGGIASIVNYYFKNKKIINLGFKRKYVFEASKREEIHKKYGISIQKIKKILK